jgi:hypothetical protein
VNESRLQCRPIVTAIILAWLFGCAGEDPATSAAPGPSQPEAGATPDASGALDAATLDAGNNSAVDATYTIDTGANTNGDASQGEGGPTNCAAREVEADVMKVVQPADIIIAIDSSGSMDEEISFVQMQMNAFSQQIVSSGIDVRVILIGEAGSICIGAPLGSGTCPADSKLPNYLHVDSEVESHDGLNVILDSYSAWSGQLRLGASKSFVIITDDEAEDGPNDSAAAFTANLEALNPQMFAEWTFNGIFVLNECDLGEEVGQVYIDLVAQTQGVSGDLCLQDLKPVFDRLSQQIITGSVSELLCEWDVPDAPSGEKLDFGSVNVRYTDGKGTQAALGKVPSQAECPNFKNGWYYDNEQNPTKIFACPQSCAEMKMSAVSKVEILLGCKSEPPPPVLN